MKLNLRNRILLPAVALVVVTTGALCVVSFVIARNALRTNLDAQVTAVSAAGTAQIETFIRDQQLNVVHWSQMAHVKLALGNTAEAIETRKTLTVQLVDALNTYGCFQNLQLVDEKGDTLSSSDPSKVGVLNVSDRQYFQDALGGKVVISEVLKSKTSGTPICVVAAPVTDTAGRRGVIFGSLNLETFNESLIRKIKVLQSGYAYVADKNGLVMAHPDPKNVLTLKLPDHDWGVEMLRQKTGCIRYEFGGISKYGYFCTSSTLGWIVVVTVPVNELEAPAYRAGVISVLIGLGIVVIGIVITGFVAKSISHPIIVVSEQLQAGADQTAAASTQVSASSQQLAEAANEQAASLEETSASLEEVASMTRSNAEHAQQAKELASQTRAAADSGVTDMHEMKEAMDGIKSSSDGISKIIKTIDEIAFQTNILALNAAVEAARAGEAGMGFAVVAEEVRNLAQRSATSAKETAAKIEEAIARSEHGVKISAKVAGSLAQILEKARKVDALVGDIAQASKEQNLGIAQVNTAVTQMDKLTQSNAATAEETAAAAEELNSQSIVMHETIADLRTLITGKDHRTGTSTPGEQATDEKISKARTPAVRRPLLATQNNTGA